MKTSYVFLAIIGILMYNIVLIKRDEKMFKAYDRAVVHQEYIRACKELPQPHPDCNLK